MKTILPQSLLRLWFGVALVCSLAGGGLLRADETLSGAPVNPVGSGYSALVAKAVSDAAARVRHLANSDPEAFAAVLRQAFEARLSPEIEHHFVEKARRGELPLPARVLAVTDETLPNAGAAYVAGGGGAILLNVSFSTDPEMLSSLVVHEWGHHLDALLGEGDSDRDEGKVFLLGVRHGGSVPAAYAFLSGSRLDDSAVIEFEGETVQVECFFKALGNWFKQKVVDPVVNTVKNVANTVADVAGKAVSFVGNVGQAVGNGIAGVAAGIASGAAHMTGNSKLGDSIAAESRKQFAGSFSGLKGAANDAVGSVASLGDLYNKTTVELNKVVPHLGTVAGIAAGFTPAGPALAFVKGVADVKNVVENGGSIGAIAGAVGFAALDFGGAKLGRVAGGISAAKAAGATAKAGATAASTGAKVAAKAPGFFGKVGNVVKAGGTKALSGIKTVTRPLTKLADRAKAATTGSWRLTKATASEISKGRSLLANSSWKGTAIEYLKKVDTFVRPKDFISGRDRDKNDGRLLGTGGNDWNNHANAVADGATEKWNKARDLFNGEIGKKEAVPGTIRPATKAIPVIPIGGFKNLTDRIRSATTNLTALAPSNSRTINPTGGGGASVSTAPAAPATLSLRGRVSGQDDKGTLVGVIPGAKVELFRADKSPAGSATANETGFYHLPGLQAGSYTYRVSANGYTPDEAGRGMVMSPGCGGQVFDFILSTNKPRASPSGIMTGRAWEEKGGNRTPMAGVKVVAKLESGGSGYQEGYTDRDGVYSFTLTPGMWKASAVPIGLDSKLYPGVVTVRENAPATADFVFSRESANNPANAGDVVALVSVPVRSAPTTPFVWFVNVATREVIPGKTKPVTTSGELRWYEAVPTAALAMGRYRAESDFQGFPKTYSMEKTLSAGQTTWFDIAFVPDRRPGDVSLTDAGNPAANPANGVVFGTVFRGEGRNKVPLASTMISLRPAAGGSIRTVTTDANGGYRLEVPASDWQVSALTPDFKASVYPAVVSVKPRGEEAAHFNFPADNTAGGAPNKDAYVMTSVETDRGGNARAPEIHFVSEDGNVRIPGVVEPIQGNPLAAGGNSKSWKWFGAKPSQPLPAGTYRVQGRSDGCESGSTDAKVVSKDSSVIFDLALNRVRVDTPVDIAPKPMPVPVPMPEVDVLTSYEDYRINGVRVQLVKKAPGTGEGKTVTLTTDDEGRAKGILAEGEGAYSVVASIEGYRDYLGDVVVSESNRSLKIEMIPLPRAVITAKNSAGVPLPGVDIRLIEFNDDVRGTEAGQKLSDDRGMASLVLKDGVEVYAIRASLNGYLEVLDELNLNETPASPGSLLREKSITLYKEGESRPVDLSGVLVELGRGHDKAYKDGKKIPNAQIIFQPSAGMTLPAILTSPLRTGTVGEFAAKAIPEGTYTVSISAEGYEEFTGPLKVESGMEPLLLSLKPRNAARDNWIRMILTEGWGDLLRSRQFHESGTGEDPTDSNVDYALGLSALQAKDKANSLPAFALAVGKASEEKWWDRACEAHLWTLMHHQETATAVSEIRRLVASEYRNRAESNESRETAFMCGVAVGVLMGPWTTEATGQEYLQLDAEITASLQGTHLISYNTGKRSVTDRFTQLSEAEAKAKKDLADAAEGERARMIADLEKRVQQLQMELNANTGEQEAQNQQFANYRANAETLANTHTARLAELVAEATLLQTEVAQLQESMNSGMQAQANRRLEELQGGLTSNLAAQESELLNFTNYRNGVEPQATGYVNRMNEITAELQKLANDFANAQANPTPAMTGGDPARLAQIEGELGATINQKSLLTERINALQAEAQAQINTYNAQLQQIVNDQNARQQRVNDLNALPPYCPVCINFAEKPADCEDCAQLRREREAEVIRLNQEFAQDQARDQEIRNLLEGVQNNYNAALATFNEQITPMNAQETSLREEYNRLAQEANKAPAPNPMLAEIQNRDAALRVEYQEKEAMHGALTAEYGQREAEYLAKINQLKATEAALRQEMANAPAAPPGGGADADAIAAKTARYTQIQAEYKDAESKLAKVQEDYRLEGEKHQQEILRLTGLATTLTNQINEASAQMGSMPGPGTTPGEVGAETRTSMAFATYLDYPLEQRRQELLDWVSRGANLATPATTR